MLDMRTNKQKAIDSAAKLIARRVWVLHGGGRVVVTDAEIKSLLEQEFAGVHEIEEDDGK
jgi:hypothetical protein